MIIANKFNVLEYKEWECIFNMQNEGETKFVRIIAKMLDTFLNWLNHR